MSLDYSSAWAFFVRIFRKVRKTGNSLDCSTVPTAPQPDLMEIWKDIQDIAGVQALGDIICFYSPFYPQHLGHMVNAQIQLINEFQILSSTVSVCHLSPVFLATGLPTCLWFTLNLCCPMVSA